MEPVGLMKSTRKQKLIAMIGFFLRIFFPTHFDLWKGIKKFWMGGWGVGLSKYSVYSWPSFVMVKTRFGQVSN